MTPEARDVSLFAPVRDDAGGLLGAVALDVDPRRYAAQAVDRGGLPGDLWFALDGEGHALVMPAQARGTLLALARRGDRAPGGLGRRRAASSWRAATSSRSARSTRTGSAADEHRLATARVHATGWIFVEGLRAERLARDRGGARSPGRIAKLAELRRDAALLFGLLLLARSRDRALGVPAHLVPDPPPGRRRRGDGPRPGGRGAAARTRRDELGRLAAAIDRMGRRVERRVETLHRLHGLLRAAHPTADLAGGADSGDRGDRGLHRRRARLVLLPRPGHEPARSRLAGLEPARGARAGADRFPSTAVDREHGVQDGRDPRLERPAARSVLQPPAPGARERRQRDLRAAQDGGQDDRRASSRPTVREDSGPRRPTP